MRKKQKKEKAKAAFDPKRKEEKTKTKGVTEAQHTYLPPIRLHLQQIIREIFHLDNLETLLPRAI